MIESKTRLVGIFVLSLLLFSIYTSLLPAAHAAEPNLQASSLKFLDDVIGIKTSQYNITKSILRDTKSLDTPQKELDFNLASASSSVRVTCTYTKNTLQLVYLSDLDGDLNLKTQQQDATTVDLTKDLLANCQRGSGDAVYGEFASMLNNIGIGENVTKVAGNVKLEVSNPQQNTTNYMWTYIDCNGVVAERKNVCLTYERGMFKAFYNNWPLYTIADTVPKLSAEQATALAIEASKNFSYSVTDANGTETSVSGFSIAPESLGHAKLVYVNSKEQAFARGGDPYQMYLAWFVPLGFDRFYPGDVSGLTVILWADTGEICGMDRVIVDSGLASSASTGNTTRVDAEESFPISATQLPLSSPSQAVGLSAVVGWLVGYPPYIYYK